MGTRSDADAKRIAEKVEYNASLSKLTVLFTDLKEARIPESFAESVVQPLFGLSSVAQSRAIEAIKTIYSIQWLKPLNGTIENSFEGAIDKKALAAHLREFYQTLELPVPKKPFQIKPLNSLEDFKEANELKIKSIPTKMKGQYSSIAKELRKQDLGNAFESIRKILSTEIVSRVNSQLGEHYSELVDANKNRFGFYVNGAAHAAVTDATRYFGESFADLPSDQRAYHHLLPFWAAGFYVCGPKGDKFNLYYVPARESSPASMSDDLFDGIF